MKKLIKTILPLLLALYAGMLYGQMARIDSLKKAAFSQQPDTGKVITLNSISDAYSFTEPDSAFIYAQAALDLAESLHYKKGAFWAIVYSNKALYVLGNYTLELSFALKAFPLGQELNDPAATGWSLGMLGDCYYNLGQYDTALGYYKQIIQLAERDSINDLFSMYSGLVPVLVHLHQYDSALIYAKKGLALQMSNHVLNQPDEQGNAARMLVYRFMGEAFAATRQFDSALYYYYRSSVVFMDTRNTDINRMDVYNGMAGVFKKMGIADSAAWYAWKVMGEGLSKKYPVSYLAAANTLADVYEDLHFPDSTLKYLRIAYAINDSLFNKDKTIAIQNIFFTEKQKRKELEEVAWKLQERYKSFFALVVLVAGLIIAGIVLRNKRLRQLQSIRNTIADDLHDDIGSSLSSIGIMSELAKQKSPQAVPLLESIGQNAWAIQDNMSDIVWTIKSANDDFEQVVRRMQVFAREILDASNMELDFYTQPSLITARLSMKQRKNFFFFFKEVINNAAKYSKAGRVSVLLSKKQHQLEMLITDDGIGFDTQRQFTGNGMASLKNRAAILQAHFNINARIGGGTVVRLLFKIT